MPYLIGMDEAGYGPNLGPLVISGSMWWVPEEPHDVDLYARLAGVVGSTASRDRRDGRAVFADSKQLYKPGTGLAALERSLLAAVALFARRPTDWGELWQLLCGTRGAHRQPLPWYADYTRSLPLAADADEVDQLASRLRDGVDAAGVRLITIRSVGVFPHEFNVLTEQLGSKGSALTRLSLELLSGLIATCDEPVLVICDKHGGRNRYAAMLHEHFPDYLVEVHRESRAESVYRFGPAKAKIEVRFAAGGERFLPTALSSMASKYLRELAMGALNRFWCSRVPGLRPTAGYPQDARRFHREIAVAQQAADIDDAILWRLR